MKYHVLLLEDLTNYGRKGDLARVAPGFARNFLLPEGKALLATPSTIKMQANLKKERDEQAKKDKVESEKLAASLKGRQFSTVVKVDNDGHMYGSVSSKDIAVLLFNEGVTLDKKHVALHSAIKTLGTHTISLKLPESVVCEIIIEIKPDRIVEKKKKKEAKEQDADASLEAPEVAE
jgi:large subunit ribosomal protein L9